MNSAVEDDADIMAHPLTVGHVHLVSLTGTGTGRAGPSGSGRPACAGPSGSGRPACAGPSGSGRPIDDDAKDPPDRFAAQLHVEDLETEVP